MNQQFSQVLSPSVQAEDSQNRQLVGSSSTERTWRARLRSAFGNRAILLPVISLIIFVTALWDFSGDLRTSPFHPDESRWINRAYYLREILDPLGSTWTDRYLIRGQPPMGSYMTGLSLLAQGNDLNTNEAWDFQFGFESNVTWNITRNGMPTESDLLAARRGSMVFGALTAVVLFLIVAELTNLAGGIAAASVFFVNPLNHYLSALGTSDAVFTLFVALSVLAAIWLAKRPTWWRAGLLALAMAAGASTKLSPIGLAAGFAIYGAVLLVDPWLHSRARLSRAWRWISRAPKGTERPLGWMLGVQPAVVSLLFILSYPYLWSAPIQRTRYLFAFRRQEMDNQAGFWPQAAITSREEALRRTWENLNDRYSSSERLFRELGDLVGADWSGLRFDLYLAVPGLLILLYLAWANGLASTHALAASAIFGQSALILYALGVDFNRYYLPLLLATSLGVGVLIGCMWDVVWAMARRTLRARESTVAEQARPPVNTLQVGDS